MISLFILIIPFYQSNILKVLTKNISDIKLGAIIATIILFFIPSMFMGLITPIIVKLKLEDINTAGKVSGRINAIATIGGIIGTFLGGFVLIPLIGSKSIIFVLTIIIVLLIPLIECKLKDYSTIFVIIMIIISAISMYQDINTNNNNGQKVLEGNTNEYVSYDTQYGRVIIYNSQKDNENVRILNIDGGYESITYTDEEKVNELVSQYTKCYDLMFEGNMEVKDVLMIGGAGYSYPKYFISHYEDKNIDVVEIDKDITEIAKKYFYLDKLIKDYDIENNKRLSLINEDGRTYLNNNQKKYDAILNDAFSGKSPAKTLTTIENIRNIKKSLNEDGVYLSNIISSLEGEDSKFLKAEVNTLRQIFKNVYVIPCTNSEDTTLCQNNMVVATDSIIKYDKSYDLKIDRNEIIITDDYCPIDTLIPKK